MGFMRSRARKVGSKHTISVGQVKKLGPALGRARAGKKQDACTKKVLEVSVTVSWGGDDVDIKLLENLERFLKEQTLASKCSIERDRIVFHLHFQMVVRIVARSVVAVSKLVKRYLGWDTSPSPSGAIMCLAFCRERGCIPLLAC